MTTWTLSLLLAVSAPAEQGAAWYTNYSAAYAQVQAADKPLFIVFCPHWSHYAEKAKQGLFLSQAVERTLQTDYVRMIVDTTSQNGRALARQFGVRSELHFVILDRSGKWQLYYHSGFLPERDLSRALAQFRRGKLGPDGVAVPDGQGENRFDVATTPATESATQGAAPTTPAATVPQNTQPATVAVSTPATANQTTSKNAATAPSVMLAESRYAWKVDVTDADFEREVIVRSHERPVVVDFWAEWCGPCRALAPMLERAAAERAGQLVLAKVNIDRAPGTSSRYRVEAIPTLKIFRDGRQVYETVGLISESQLRQILDRIAGAPGEQIAVQPTEPSDTTRR